MSSPSGFLQGYNAQAVTTGHQVIVAAEILTEGTTRGRWPRWSAGGRAELGGPDPRAPRGGARRRRLLVRRPDRPAARARHDPARRRPTAARGAHDKGHASAAPTTSCEERSPPTGEALYRRRKWMIEPVFAHIKFNRRAGRFKRRGRAAVRSEWRLIAATHNLLKLHRHRLALAAG